MPPIPHLLPLKRWRITYLCAHGSTVRHRVVLRASTLQAATAWAQILLAGEVLSIEPLPDRVRLPASLIRAKALQGAITP